MIVVYPTPATTILTLPLPANAAQETGGNLTALTQLIELHKQTNALLAAIVLHLNSATGQAIALAPLLEDGSIAIQ